MSIFAYKKLRKYWQRVPGERQPAALPERGSFEEEEEEGPDVARACQRETFDLDATEQCEVDLSEE